MVSETQSDGATPLDPNEAEGLIPTHVTTREELNRLEQENIVDALQWLETARSEHILSETFVRKLHQKMFGRTWKWAGKFRNSGKNIGSPWEKIGVELHELLENTKTQVEHKSYPPDEIAWRFHHPFTWGGMSGVPEGEVRAAYLNALRNADRGDYGKLAEFVRSN